MSAEKCGGLFYKCRKSVFVNKVGIFIRKFYLRPMKRVSCNGCERCDLIKDELKNEIHYSGDVQIKKFNDGEVYEAIIIPTGDEDYRIDFVPTVKVDP